VLSIMGLVIVVRSALIPLFVRQIKSQRKMMEIAPELRKVQEKYRGKKDQLSREAMSRETMALYKKHGTTPVSSCLPLLVQMPILLGMFYTLSDVKKHAEWGFGGVGCSTRTSRGSSTRRSSSASRRCTPAWSRPSIRSRPAGKQRSRS
jgi:YidC/Oxa1 family membrane protein insertase